MERIERAFAALGARFAQAGMRLGCEAGLQTVGSGWATFLGVGSPLTHVIGTDGRLTRDQLQELEAFFFRRGADSVVEVADAWQLGPWLVSQGYELAGSEQVLERGVDGDFGPQAAVVECGGRIEEWILAVQTGFGMEPSGSGRLLGELLATQTPLGVLRHGQIAASAAHAVLGETGYCFADSTLPGFRGQGFQQALIRHRLWLTGEAGAQYCVAETLPGSASERNYLRTGFRKAYVRQTFVKRLVVGDAAVGEA